ncbi:MAG TPA: type II toxin-antitoxin system Phd/YefM family antitoxin [Acidobacteriaceae bacterium]|jgi:prevent-host-death family protein
MRSISATEAKQNLASVLDTAQREPVVIRRHDRDVAVVLSAVEYERLRGQYIAEFEQFCDKVAAEAAARGMTPEILEQLLSDDNSAASGR